MELLRKSNTASAAVFPLVSLAARPDFKSGATFEAGDVKVIRHTGGAWNVANIGTLPVEISTTGNYYIPLTATELNPDDTKYPVIVKIVDQTNPKVWDDTEIIISFVRSDDIATLLTDTGLIKGYTDTLETVLGSPAGASMSADIAAVKADCVTIKGYTDSIEGVLGTPVGASLSADIAAVKADCVTIKGYTDSVEGSLTTALADLVTIKNYTDSIEGVLGTPAGASVSADVAAVKADCVTIKSYTDTVEASLTTALADLVTLKGYTDSLETGVGSVLSDTSVLKADTTTIKSDLSTTKSDVATIKSKLPAAGDIIAADADMDDVKSKVTTIYTALPAATATIASQNDVLAIQNNTNFAASVASPIILPAVGDEVWVPITCQLRDESGNMEDPDSNELTIQVRADAAFSFFTALYTDRNGDTLLTASSTFTDFYKLTRISQGVYEGWMKVTSGCFAGSYTITFKYKESTITQVYTRNTEMTQKDANLNVVLANNADNKLVIAQAMKESDVSESTVVDGSIMHDLLTDLSTIINKLPAGTISDLSLSTTVENVTLSTILSLMMAMVDGKYVINTDDGTITFLRRDNTTPITVVTVTETTRVRNPLP